MKDMTLKLPAELQRFVDAKVQSGEYESESELIRIALEQFREEDEWDADLLEHYRRQVAIGVNQAERGELVEFSAEDVIAEGRQRLAQGRDE